MYPTVRTLLISEIIVENRRREDFGDIEGLAESIRKYGLFHPIVVDDKNRLVAGERRLRACKLLGMREISVRTYRDLTDDERSEIELEENLRRKDLTPYEQSRNIVRLAETAAKVLKNVEPKHSTVVAGSFDSSFTVNDESKRKRGGQEKSASLDKISERIGISQPTISRAKTHVEAVQKYPELASIPTQKDALTIAKNLDALPEAEREQSRVKLKENDSLTLTTLAEKPPERVREFPSGETPGERWTKLLYKNQVLLTNIESNGGINNLARGWTQRERQYFYERVREMARSFAQIQETMEGLLCYDNTESDARENVA